MSRQIKVAKAKYSFAKHGGAIGAIVPNPFAKLPVGAVITKAWTEGANLATSSAAEIAVAVGGVTIKAATVATNAAYDGLDAQLAATTLNKVTTNAPITVTISVGTVTAGTLNIFVEYTV